MILLYMYFHFIRISQRDANRQLFVSFSSCQVFVADLQVACIWGNVLLLNQ